MDRGLDLIRQIGLIEAVTQQHRRGQNGRQRVRDTPTGEEEPTADVEDLDGRSSSGDAGEDG